MPAVEFSRLDVLLVKQHGHHVQQPGFGASLGIEPSARQGHYLQRAQSATSLLFGVNRGSDQQPNRGCG